MSTPTIILLLTNTGLSAFLANRKTAQPLLPATDETGEAEALRELAQKWPHARYHLLTDLAEEDFQYEQVPHLHAVQKAQDAPFAGRFQPGIDGKEGHVN